MPLIIIEPSKKAFQLVSNAVRDLMDAPEKLQLAVPLQVYTMSAKDVAKEDLAMSQLTAWRYMILRDDEPIAAAEIDIMRNSRPKFSHLNTGPYVEACSETLMQAEKLEAVAKDDYYVRTLRIPALYVMVLWLHGAKNDIMIPMGPVPEYLVSNKIYSPEQLFRKLKPAAEDCMMLDSSPNQDESIR